MRHGGPYPMPAAEHDPEDEGRAAIQDILRLLGDGMTLKHPAYQAPSLDDPDKRRAELLEQARQILTQSDGKV